MKSFQLLAAGLGLGASVLFGGCGGAASGSGSSGGSGGGGGNNNPQTPAISSISPKSVPAGSDSLTLTIAGSGFLSTSAVQVGGTSESITYVSDAQLTATVPAAQLTKGSELAVVVANGSLTSSSGTPFSLEVDNPSPAISSILPTSETVNASTPVVNVTGTGFVSTTVIEINGAARPTTFLSATQVSAALTAADVSAAGTLSLTAVNPVPGGGASTAVSLPVNNPSVGTIRLNPSALPVGASLPVTITVTGAGFVPASMVAVNGVTRATTYFNSTTVTFVATVADQATVATLSVTVTTPGSGTSSAAILTISGPTATPVITSVTPTSIVEGSPDTGILVAGTGFTLSSVVQWNGAALGTTAYYYLGGIGLYAFVPAADLAAVGTASVTVNTPTSSPSMSNAVSFAITNPPVPTLTSIYPSGGPINTAATVGLYGTGFTTLSTVSVNGQTVSSSFVNSTQINCTIPASALALPGNTNITVTTPAPGGGTSAPMAYTTYLAIANNDIAYNATDGLLYASVPVSAVGSGGNSVVGIDPVTGTVTRQIWVGSNPNKLALSTDGTQLFVGLDGAGAVAQVNLSTGAVVNQFSLGDGSGTNGPPYTANYLAAVPGSPNSVAVATAGSYYNGAGATIYDSGVPRANSTNYLGYGPLSFGSSSSILYVANDSGIEQLAVDSTGVTAATSLAATNSAASTIQYDNGRLYLSSGQAFNASTGALLGTFYSSANTPANGPIVSDSTLSEAFVGFNNYNSSGQVLAFNESTFNATGSIPVNAIGVNDFPTGFQKIVRWGQNGLALSPYPSTFTSLNQIYIFQSPLVKDLSASPADLSVALTAPATTTTGTAISWVAKIKNNGPDVSSDVALTVNLDSSLIINSITPSQGTCSAGPEFSCDLGSVANGASVTVTVNATPSTAGTLAGTATVSSASYDPTTTNNQATTSTVVSGSPYGASPLVSAISPNLVQAGSPDFTLTVTGTGFNEDSTVDLGNTALVTTYVSATQLTAEVTASEIANYGWGAVTVTNPAPGGGVSQILPLTIYALVNVPASGLLFDPYSQWLYATLPSTATNITGDSVVTIDPFTGAVGTPVVVGSEPTVMTETADGKYLYVSLTGSDSVAQFDPIHQTLLQTISLSSASNEVGSNPVATNLSVMPGTDTTLAVGFSVGDGILDTNGGTGAFRANFAGGISPQFGDASTLYTISQGTLYRSSVNANGATQIDATALDGLGNFGNSIELANGLVYGSDGGIINPVTTPPSQIATLPFFDFYDSDSIADGVAVAPDPSLQKSFLMMVNEAGTWAYGLARYDLNTYTPEALVDMPELTSNFESAWTMFRFGQDGLALLASGENYSNNQVVTTLMLLRGPFVTPQELTTNSAAVLTSSSPGSITHGSGNIILTLTGSNLLPGVAITWNGSYRTTTWVSSTHATMAIPASDLAHAGTASLVATNPGALSSNSLQLTIN